MSRLNFSAPKYITSDLMMRLTMVLRTLYSSCYRRLSSYIYIGNKRLFRFSEYYGLITSDPDFKNIHNFRMHYK